MFDHIDICENCGEETLVDEFDFCQPCAYADTLDMTNYDDSPLPDFGGRFSPAPLWFEGMVEG